MFLTAVCVLFLIKLRWPKKRSTYDIVEECFVTHKVVAEKFCSIVSFVRRRSSFPFSYSELYMFYRVNVFEWVLSFTSIPKILNLFSFRNVLTKKWNSLIQTVKAIHAEEPTDNIIMHMLILLFQT